MGEDPGQRSGGHHSVWEWESSALAWPPPPPARLGRWVQKVPALEYGAGDTGHSRSSANTVKTCLSHQFLDTHSR